MIDNGSTISGKAIQRRFLKQPRPGKSFISDHLWMRNHHRRSSTARVVSNTHDEANNQPRAWTSLCPFPWQGSDGSCDDKAQIISQSASRSSQASLGPGCYSSNPKTLEQISISLNAGNLCLISSNMKAWDCRHTIPSARSHVSVVRPLSLRIRCFCARETGFAALPPCSIVHPSQVKGESATRPSTSLRIQSIYAAKLIKIEEWST